MRSCVARRRREGTDQPRPEDTAAFAAVSPRARPIIPRRTTRTASRIRHGPTPSLAVDHVALLAALVARLVAPTR